MTLSTEERAELELQRVGLAERVMARADAIRAVPLPNIGKLSKALQAPLNAATSAVATATPKTR